MQTNTYFLCVSLYDAITFAISLASSSSALLLEVLGLQMINILVIQIISPLWKLSTQLYSVQVSYQILHVQ